MKDLIRKTLDVAKRDDLPVKIVYEGKKGITERVIIIKRIDEDRVIAYCRLRRRISSFKLDGILAAEVVRKDPTSFL